MSCCQHSLHFIINPEFKFCYWYTVCLAADTWICCWLWWKQWWKNHLCLWAVWEHSCLGVVKAFMIQSRTIHWRVHLRTLQHAPSPEILATHVVRRVQTWRQLQRVWVVCGLQAWTVLPGSGWCTSQSAVSKLNFTLQLMNTPHFIFRHAAYLGLILFSLIWPKIYLKFRVFFQLNLLHNQFRLFRVKYWTLPVYCKLPFCLPAWLTLGYVLV